jgi:hypothetical protein
MKRDDVFPSKYRKAAGLKGKARNLEIDHAAVETLKNIKGEEEQKIVLYFVDAKKVMPLAMTDFGAGRCHADVFCDPEDPPTDGRWVVLVKADFADSSCSRLKCRKRPSSSGSITAGTISAMTNISSIAVLSVASW